MIKKGINIETFKFELKSLKKQKTRAQINIKKAKKFKAKCQEKRSLK